ncbi:hypothetical protein [Iningainema tapete]|uniref:Uncharacterized protein n=1 Tax=Iningainema tapete BLCC-T55 TaxID=2748662 RepID=A0A8J6XYJ0_9CYAN|nr:hypothetical protein [Iningainema tapete]MBD2778642.1 hypothetical protein [Iningainema tapete BLCC-T55]
MLEITFVTVEDIRRLLDSLTPQEREAILAQQIAELLANSKAKVMELGDSNLTIVTGLFVPLNTDVAVNIQNASKFDPEIVLKALTDFRKSERDKK